MLTTFGVDKDEKEKKILSSENENLHENHMKSKIGYDNHEPEMITSAVENLKNYFRPEDAKYWEEEVKDMLANVKNVHKALSEEAKINTVFRFRSEEFEDQELLKSKFDLKSFMAEIEKMDAILKIKGTEEKQAKLSRIKAEEESKNILITLPCPKSSGGVKINLEEFLRLLNEADKNEQDSSSSCKASEVNEIASGDRGEEKKEVEKAAPQHQKTHNLKFVERNIQLAKCGRGTLSLTDQEKSRIESLLAGVENLNTRKVKESEDSNSSNLKKNSINEKKLYGMDDETKSILSQIDEQLEVLVEVRKPEEYQRKISWFKKNESEKNLLEEKETRNEIKEKKEKVQEKNRLKKINKLLNSINSISNEEISPLTEEEMENLIRESKETLNRDSASGEEARCTHERITELVSNAKLLMPKFKYRFDQF